MMLPAAVTKEQEKTWVEKKNNTDKDTKIGMSEASGKEIRIFFSLQSIQPVLSVSSSQSYWVTCLM